MEILTFKVVFQVEYKEDSLDQTLHALAEAPKEALPLDCRPSFNVAWLTKDKFKVRLLICSNPVDKVLL